MRPSFSKKLLLPAVALLTLSFGGTAAAAEDVLVPLIIYPPGVPGQNGALWVTDFTMENYGDRAWFGPFAAACSIDGVALSAHSTRKNPFCPPVTGEGAVVGLDEDQLMRFQLRVRDVNSSAVSRGMEIPVVRESDWLRGSSAILDIPSGEGFRRTIRVYNLSYTEPFRFTLKIRPLLETTVVFESTHVVHPPTHPAVTALVRLDDGDTLPDLQAYGDLKFEIVPDLSDAPYWWFLSFASNTTNELSIATPQ